MLFQPKFKAGPVLIMFSCDWALQEAQNIIPICYKYQQDFSTSSGERQELICLTNQALNNKPAFTAAGFFEINRKTLLALLSATTTYFIVIIQFNQM
ncbi:hypothetical protein NQ314_008647 [Rhamnusium bicolor]|uniref:Uncharacterized protein n=1 Tax=Rhamnusium bicolor TaxID=1586634 RepID=A0AAV8YAB5_9CUCU|nr:hypothetical protein NQ314_008647 [Rhamnusium bicolor]